MRIDLIGLALLSVNVSATELRQVEVDSSIRTSTTINSTLVDPNQGISTEIHFEEFVTNIILKEDPDNNIAIPPTLKSALPFWLDGDAPIADVAPISLKGNLKIGIKWPCRADIDIYSRSNRNYNYLYFGNKKTPEGVYYRDYLTSPEKNNAIEYLEYTESVDIRDIEILLNFYSGFCKGGAQGVVRAWIDNQIYELPFHLKANSGNRARSSGGIHGDKHWLSIDIAKLFKLEN